MMRIIRIVAKPVSASKKLKTSGQLTRDLFRAMGYKIHYVESQGFGGCKKDLLGFIDDLAFKGPYCVALQSCTSEDVAKHRQKFKTLCGESLPIVDWIKFAPLWLVWWDKSLSPHIEVLNPELGIDTPLSFRQFLT